VHRYCTAGRPDEERERFEALLQGVDYDREQRRKLAAWGREMG